jgi:predicted DNA-binding transcriptional regulator AlpA
MSNLGISEVARLLGVSRPRVWQLRKRPDFPQPCGREHGREVWDENDIVRWGAANGRGRLPQTPLLFLPSEPGVAAHYLGAQMAGEFVLLSWDTAAGCVCVAYEHTAGPPAPRNPVSDLADRIRGADVLVVVESYDWNAFGPGLTAVDLANPAERYMPRWGDLARLFGAPVPYWPERLEDPELMMRWAPGDPPAVILATPTPDTTPLLQLAAAEPETGNASRTTRTLAKTIQDRATRRALHDIELLSKVADRDSLTLAATPYETSPADNIPEDARREGWLQILGRRDELAFDCVRIALQWNSGADFPFSSTTEVRAERGSIAEEWAAALDSGAARTAAYVIFGGREAEEDVKLLHDPAMDVPVIKTDRSTFRAAIPQRLPATAPLSKVILYYGNVWIRTEDGGLYLAPQQPGRLLSWGYSGTGPCMLAILLDRLLNDINAPAPGYNAGNPRAGLGYLTEHAPDEGAIFTRAQLSEARGS